MKRWLVCVILLMLGCVVLAACGGSATQGANSSSSASSPTPAGAQSSSSPASTPTPQSSSSTPQGSSTAAQTVNVLEGEMYIKSDVKSFKVGTLYHFNVKNEGKVIHEFTIAKKVPGGNQDSRDAASVKDVDDIRSGQTVTFDFIFQEPVSPVGMEFECSYPGHYEMGMHMDITVQ